MSRSFSFICNCLLFGAVLFLFTSSPLAQTTVVVNQTDINGWVFYNDENDTINPTLGSFVTGPGTPPAGTGGVQISVTGTQRRNLSTFQFSGTPLADITTFRYSTYNPSAGNGGSVNRAGFLFFNVDFNGSDTWQRRLVYVPSNNGAVIQNTWQEWDAINGGNALWSYSGATWPIGIGGGGEIGTTLKTWNQILSQYPGVRIRVTDANLGIRVGEPYVDGYTENVDLFKFGTASGTTHFDFEPSTSLAVSPAGTPNALDNDYTRLNNAVQAVANGGTITLSGTFNWAETNAANSWARGSDGIPSTSDDWGILAKANLNGVTVTASSLGAATIVGPGDVPSVDLEGVFQFYAGGSNQNWTISNLRLHEFDNPIGFYHNGGPVTAYSGTQILNNEIRLARDLNGVVAPSDAFQNIGIHYAFGTNQTISGNVIEIYGDGASDPTANPANFERYSATVAMQSNTSGGAVYNGLQITNNAVRILNAQNANPERIRGIWENGHAHSSNVQVSGNSFVNLDPGNNPSLNLQIGFRVTSHSSATTTVTYSNNTASGANVGFEWLDVSAGLQPVQMTSNTATGNVTAFLIRANGTANFRFNRIVGNSTAGIDSTLASAVTANDNWWGCNYGPGAGGAGCVGTANGILGAATATTWLTLTTSALPASVSNGGNSAVTSRLTINSASADTSGSGNVMNGTPMNFAGALGSVSPSSAGTTAGVAGTTFTATGVGAGGTSTTVDAQTVTAPITVQPVCNNISIASGQTTLRNASLTIPITTDSMTGQEVYSYDFTYTYDPATLTYTGVSNAGTLSSGFTVSIATPVAGTLVVSGFGTSPLSGSGTLLNVNFTASGPIDSVSNLTLSPFVLNEGAPWCQSISNGSISIISGTIDGTVSYLNQDGQNPQPRVVPGVDLNAPGTPNVSGSTNGLGVYSLSGFGSSGYTVTPSKTAEVYTNANTGITANDAARIAQHVVGIPPALTANQLLAADVSNNGTVTSFDSSIIARWVVGIAAPGVTGTWRFQPTSRTYTLAEVETGMTGQNYDAILMGDVTGNWNVPTPLWEALSDFDKEQAIEVGVPEVTGSAGSEIEVPIRVGETTGKGIISYQFELRFDPEVLDAGKTPCVLADTVSGTMTINCNADVPGIVRVAVYGVNPLVGKGDLLRVKLSVVGEPNSTTAIDLGGFKFNESFPFAQTTNGRVTVVSANASSSISGRILTSTGNPISRATVTIRDSAGTERSATTNQLGRFVFSELRNAETYTISTSAKGHNFTPRTVVTGDDAVVIDIVSDGQ